MKRPRHVSARSLRAVAARFLLLGGGFVALAEGEGAVLPFGAVVALLATLGSLRLARGPLRLGRPSEIVRLLVFFGVGSLRGGVDVALRALHPAMPIAPSIIRHRLHLPPGPARLVFTSAMSSMPGTLAIEVEGSFLAVHALVDPERTVHAIAELEARVARAFGQPSLDTGGAHA